MTSRDFGLVSVIMAAYNAEKTIEQSINSVLNQTYPAVELLVVDDYSGREYYGAGQSCEADLQ